MGTFLVAVKTVLPLFLVLLTGILFSRTRASSDKWIEVLNKYALYIGFPALVVASLMNLEPGDSSFTKLIVLNSAYIVCCMLLAFPIARFFGLSRPMKRTLFLLLPFGNIAYLGMPVLENAYGIEILPVAAIISAVYVFWMLTLAIILIEAFGDSSIRPKKLILSLAQNPLLLSVFVGLIIVSFRLQVPQPIKNTIQLFANSVTAVVLFSLGIFLGMQKIGKLQDWYKVGMWIVVTMLALPFLFHLVLPLAGLDHAQFKATIVDAAMPLGLTPYVLSVQYKLNTTLMARIVVLGTILSIFIIPLWMVVLG